MSMYLNKQKKETLSKAEKDLFNQHFLQPLPKEDPAKVFIPERSKYRYKPNRNWQTCSCADIFYIAAFEHLASSRFEAYSELYTGPRLQALLQTAITYAVREVFGCHTPAQLSEVKLQHLHELEEQCLAIVASYSRDYLGQSVGFQYVPAPNAFEKMQAEKFMFLMFLHHISVQEGW